MYKTATKCDVEIYTHYSLGSLSFRRRKKMRPFQRLSFTSFLLLSLGLVLNLVFVCNGGTTSIFVRKVEKSIDMPLDSDVFKVPPGYNAPQQVFFYLSNFELIHRCF